MARLLRRKWSGIVEVDDTFEAGGHVLVFRHPIKPDHAYITEVLCLGAVRVV